MARGRPPVGGYGTQTKRVSVRIPLEVCKWIAEQTAHVNTYIKDVIIGNYTIYKYTTKKDEKVC